MDIRDFELRCPIQFDLILTQFFLISVYFHYELMRLFKSESRRETSYS